MEKTKNTSAVKYKIAQDYKYLDDDYWDWWVWIEGSEKHLDAIKSVTYTLHHTFPDPVRTKTNRKNKFKLKTAGWGVFTIYARINFKTATHIELEHELELRYPEGTKNND